MIVKELTLIPNFVLQEMFNLLARTAAVTVEPLLPPQPTSIQPTRGTAQLVLKVKVLVTGTTFSRPSSDFSTYEV